MMHVVIKKSLMLKLVYMQYNLSDSQINQKQIFSDNMITLFYKNYTTHITLIINDI